MCFKLHLVGFNLEVFFNTLRWNNSFEDSAFFIQRERDAGSRCIISVTSNNISIQDPRNPQNSRAFTFDYTYWSHSGFSRNKDGLFVPEETGGRYADQVTDISLYREYLTLHLCLCLKASFKMLYYNCCCIYCDGVFGFVESDELEQLNKQSSYLVQSLCLSCSFTGMCVSGFGTGHS